MYMYILYIYMYIICIFLIGDTRLVSGENNSNFNFNFTKRRFPQGTAPRKHRCLLAIRHRGTVLHHLLPERWRFDNGGFH